LAATIYIAAGHGGNDPGAVNGKYIEKALTLKTALACQNYLRNYECETVMARTTDKSCTVAHKMEEVEKKRPSLVLEIHYNAGGGEGCEVYYWHTHAPSKSLAQKVLAEMVKLGQKSRHLLTLPESFLQKAKRMFQRIHRFVNNILPLLCL